LRLTMRKFALCLKLIFLLLVGKGCSSLPIWTYGEVPFVPTPPEVIDRMLEMARVKSNDMIYDIGSGDGRIIIQAAKKYGVKGVGIEIDHDLVQKARDNAVREKVEHLVEFRVQDAFTADVSPASVVTVYMLPEFNAKLRPMLEKQLRPGSRVVSHDFEIRGWKPNRIERMKGGFMHDHTIFLFEIDAPFAESRNERLGNEGDP
jgi:SAM-dependent methyltransferase